MDHSVPSQCDNTVTVDDVLTIFRETHVKCNLYTLGSHLGLSTEQLEKLDSGTSEDSYYNKATVLIRTYLQHHDDGSELIWEHLVNVLREPELKEDEAAAKIEDCYIKRRDSSISSSPSIPVSPISLTTSLTPTEQGKL